MPEEIKDLIEQIQKEGIEEAQKKAQEIEESAKKQADAIIKNAKEEAEKLIAEARLALSRMEEKQKASLTQTTRDILLSLKKEINSLLARIVVLELNNTLTSDCLSRIILELVKGQKAQGDIEISLKKEDRDAIEKGFLSKLKEELKKGITLKASEDIRAGFTISFDSGKSCYDFSDKALAEYIGQYLKPKLAELLREAIK